MTYRNDACHHADPEPRRRTRECGGYAGWHGHCGSPSCSTCHGRGVDRSECEPEPDEGDVTEDED